MERKITVTISDDDIRRQLDLVIGDQMSVEIALEHLMDDFDFDFEELLKARSIGMYNLSCLELRLNSFQKKARMTIPGTRSSLELSAWTLRLVLTICTCLISTGPEFLLFSSKILLQISMRYRFNMAI
jgi:hypothetical protein